MKKALLIILILIAIPLYSYDFYLLLGGYFSGSQTIRQSISETESDILNVFPVQKVSFTVSGRSPFLPYEVKAKPKPVVVKKRKPKPPPKPKVEIKPPSIAITGIMWNPENPVAMINLPSGQSAVAKKGQVYGDITIENIEQNRIGILYKGKKFWINR